MKLIKKASIVIIIITTILILICIWRNNVGLIEDSKTYQIFKQKYFTQYRIEMSTYDKDTKELNAKIIQQVKNNGDIYLQHGDVKNIIIENERYYFTKDNNEEEIILTSKCSDTEKEKLNLSYQFNKMHFVKRNYEFFDGKTYYVEYFEGVDDFNNNYIEKVYFKDEKFSFILEDSTNLIMYIDKFTNEIDESLFEIPKDGNYIKGE